MKIDRVLELLKIERECVTRQSPCNDKSKLCNRNCGECDIAQNDLEIIEMYDFVISMMEMKEQPDIVRCKDCIYHHYTNDSNCIPYCELIDYGYGWKDNDFCSRGKRR